MIGKLNRPNKEPLKKAKTSDLTTIFDFYVRIFEIIKFNYINLPPLNLNKN